MVAKEPIHAKSSVCRNLAWIAAFARMTSDPRKKGRIAADAIRHLTTRFSPAHDNLGLAVDGEVD
jgi:hypothetical protein